MGPKCLLFNEVENCSHKECNLLHSVVALNPEKFNNPNSRT